MRGSPDRLLLEARHRCMGVVIALMLMATASGALYAQVSPQRPKLIEVVTPEYPPIARRVNIQGTVKVQMLVDTDGRVLESEILESPADVLSKAVLQVTPKWRFTKPETPTRVTVAVPFRFTETPEVAFSYAIRPIVSKPTGKAELGMDAVNGWAEIRIIVKEGDRSQDFHVAKISGVEFRPTLEAIVARLRFSGVPENNRLGSVNALRIHVTDDAPIAIEQLPGE